MKISTIEAIPIQAAMRPGDVYWGNQAWGHNKPASYAAPGLPPGDDRSTYPPTWRSRSAYSESIDTTLVKITTDNGLVGWGEVKAPVAPGVTAAIIRDLMTGLLLGEDPGNPVLQWERLYGAMRIRGHSAGFWMEAMSGIDIALWDISAQAVGLPLYKLLGGGFRNRIKVYASSIPGVRVGAPPEAWDKMRATAEDVRDRGFEGAKVALGLGIEADIRTMQTLRQILGPDFTLFADAGGMYNTADSIRLGRALEKVGVDWLEDAVPREHPLQSAALGQALAIPIAAGMTNRWLARDMLMAGGIDVLQPDICRGGGVTECRRIAQLADSFGKAFTPHVSTGSAIHFAVSAHLAAATPNQTWMEFWYGANPIGDAILHEPLRVEQGYFWVPQKPGLGIEINEDALRHYAISA